jgi:threonine/homoserine/homoserine lactone efflux protein
MSLASLIIFCSTYLLAAATPGPGIAALLARVMGRGSKGISAFIAGFVVGDLFWFTLAATGLAMVAQTFHFIFLIIRYAGAAYLLYIAYKLWTAEPVASEAATSQDQEGQFNSFLSGLSITLGNPKVVVFFVALLPTLVDLRTLSFLGYLEIASVICVGLSCVLGAYAFAAARAQRLLSSRRSRQMLNRTTSAVMTGSAVGIVANSVAFLALGRFNNMFDGTATYGRTPST